MKKINAITELIIIADTLPTVGFEITANQSFTENLDGSYPKRFKDYELYSQKSFGGNLSQDWYVFTGFTLTYIFGNYECYCP